jgi:uncharacterized protein
MLRVHFSPDTFRALDPLVELINTEFCQDGRFAVYFKAIERLGGAKDGEIRVFTEQDCAQVKTGLDAKLDRPEQAFEAPHENYVCYAARPNSGCGRGFASQDPTELACPYTGLNRAVKGPAGRLAIT